MQSRRHHTRDQHRRFGPKPKSPKPPSREVVAFLGEWKRVVEKNYCTYVECWTTKKGHQSDSIQLPFSHDVLGSRAVGLLKQKGDLSGTCSTAIKRFKPGTAPHEAVAQIKPGSMPGGFRIEETPLEEVTVCMASVTLKLHIGLQV